MVTILTWISIFAGGLLVLLMLLSLLGGLDLDIDVGGSEIDTDGSGIGFVKGFLTFISVGSWVMKIMVGSEQNPAIAAAIGVVAGLAAFWLLSKVFKLLLRNESNVNWSMDDALFSDGEVYLKIPKDGSGLVTVEINGVNRELKAKSSNDNELSTGTKISVISVEGEYVVVTSEV